MAAIASQSHTFTADTGAAMRDADPAHTRAYRALARDLGIGEAALDPADLGSVMDDLAQLLQQVTLSAHEFAGPASALPDGTATGGTFRA